MVNRMKKTTQLHFLNSWNVIHHVAGQLHHVVPFFLDFLKDVVETIELLNGLPGLGVQRHQNKLLNSYIAGRRWQEKSLLGYTLMFCWCQ